MKRYAAAVEGAIEGFREGLEQFDLPETTKASIREAALVARAAVEEARAQGQTPEMRELGHDLQRAGHATANVTRRAKDATVHRAEAVTDAVTERAHAVQDRAHATQARVQSNVQAAKDTIRENVESAQYAAHRMVQDAKVKAEAVGESGKRAYRAPPKIARDVKQAVAAKAVSLSLKAYLGIAAGILGIAFAIITTVWVGLALTAVFGAFLGIVWGTLITALIFLAATVAGAWAMWSYASKRDEAAREHVEDAKDEVRYVAAPVKNAFRRGRAGI